MKTNIFLVNVSHIHTGISKMALNGQNLEHGKLNFSALKNKDLLIRRKFHILISQVGVIIFSNMQIFAYTFDLINF
jgi:hypothetical protein